MEQAVRELLDKIIESSLDSVDRQSEAERYMSQMNQRLSDVKDQNLIKDYGITGSSVYSYHSYKLVYKNRRWYMIPSVLELDTGLVNVRNPTLVRSKRHAVQLWKALFASGEHLVVDVWFKPVKPVEYIQLKLKVTPTGGGIYKCVN